MSSHQNNASDVHSFPHNWRSTHLADQLSNNRPVIFNTNTLYALLGTTPQAHLKILTSTGISGGTVHPDNPLSLPTKEFRIRASMGDIRQMGDCYAGVRVLDLDDPVRDEGEFNVDRELIDGVWIYLQGNTAPTRVRMLIYAENNASIPALHDKLAEHYKNPEFHFQFNLALYYEALEAQRKLLQVGADRIRETALNTAATRARVAGFLYGHDQANARPTEARVSTGAARKFSTPPRNAKQAGPNIPQQKAQTTDPRLGLLHPRPPTTMATTAHAQTPRPATQVNSSPAPAQTPSNQSSTSGLSASPPPVYTKTDKATQGAKLSPNQRRRRNRANRLASVSGSVDSTKASSLSVTSPDAPSLSRTPKPVPRSGTSTSSPSTSLSTTASTSETLQPATSTKSTLSSPRATLPSVNHPPHTPANSVASQKRQHSPPTPPHWNARGTQTLFRKNLPARQGHDWRATAEVGSSGSSTSSGLGAPYEYASPEQLRAQPTPPPFSFDHIVQARSRAIVFCPPPNSSATSPSSARSFQTTTTLRNTGTLSYVSSPASPSPSFANTVFGTSGVSLPTTQKPQAAQQAQVSQSRAPHSQQSRSTDLVRYQVPSTPLRTGGNQLDIGQQRAPTFVPNYARSVATSSERQPPIGTPLARSIPIASSSSKPFYHTTFESIPNTVEANTLMDLEHGVDDCNDYPRLSDISEMEEGELVDTDGYTTVVNKRKSKRLAMLAKRARTSEDKVSTTISTPLPPRSTLLTNSPNSQREHSYIGKGKQRARYQGSTKSRSNSGELLNLPHDLELELSAPRPQKRRDFRKDEPSWMIKNLRTHIGKIEAALWKRAKEMDGSLKTRADKWRVLSEL